MKKLIATTITAALAAILAGCATKSRSFDAKGMYVSETGQLAVGYIHVDAIPEGTESAVVHYEEDVALLSPSTKTHAIDIILTGTNSVGSAGTIVSSICKAFVSVAPKIAEVNASAPKGVTALDVAQANAAKSAEVKRAAATAKGLKSESPAAEAATAAAPSAAASGSTDADCANGACVDK